MWLTLIPGGYSMPHKAETMPTIWAISDSLWERIVPVFKELCPPARVGRRRTVDFRRVLEAVVFRMRSGCQWNHIPQEFGDDSRIHHWFQEWVKKGLFQRIWKELVSECDELGGLDWTWQSADGCTNKSRFGGGKNRSQSHRPRQGRHQEKHPGRGRRRPLGSGARRGKPA